MYWATGGKSGLWRRDEVDRLDQSDVESNKRVKDSLGKHQVSYHNGRQQILPLKTEKVSIWKSQQHSICLEENVRFQICTISLWSPNYLNDYRGIGTTMTTKATKTCSDWASNHPIKISEEKRTKIEPRWKKNNSSDLRFKHEDVSPMRFDNLVLTYIQSIYLHTGIPKGFNSRIQVYVVNNNHHNFIPRSTHNGSQRDWRRTNYSSGFYPSC